MIDFVVEDKKKKEVIAKNKCGGGIDLFITYVCREKKNEKKEEKKNVVYGKKTEKKKKGLMSHFSMI